MGFMNKLFILFQHIVPQHLLSRCTGALAELRHPVWLKNCLIRQFIQLFDVDMTEAAEPDYTRYACFNDFFTRPLRDSARPLAAADVLCPASPPTFCPEAVMVPPVMTIFERVVVVVVEFVVPTKAPTKL